MDAPRLPAGTVGWQRVLETGVAVKKVGSTELLLLLMQRLLIVSRFVHAQRTGSSRARSPGEAGDVD